MEPKSQSSVTTPLFNFFSRTAVQSPYITPMYLFDFRRQQIETGIDPVLPIIKIDKKKKDVLSIVLLLSETESMSS